MRNRVLQPLPKRKKQGVAPPGYLFSFSCVVTLVVIKLRLRLPSFVRPKDAPPKNFAVFSLFSSWFRCVIVSLLGACPSVHSNVRLYVHLSVTQMTHPGAWNGLLMSPRIFIGCFVYTLFGPSLQQSTKVELITISLCKEC